MELAGPSNVISMQLDECTKLIRKLRWIGLDEGAHRLELAVRSLPPETRMSVSAGPFSTD